MVRMGWFSPPIFVGIIIITSVIDIGIVDSQIIEPKKKVKEILKEAGGKDKIEVKKFIRFKVGEGV